MTKRKLKVNPAKSIYKPKYPSFEDKNPLLHPETKPYPFNYKCINWLSTGGLASIMILGGNKLSAQTEADSLYNPFPLENARVPYRPVSFGTGMPERISSEDAIRVIRKAFESSGIELEKDVLLAIGEDSLVMNGYSHKDQLGFFYYDWNQMDKSFMAPIENQRDHRKYADEFDLNKLLEYKRDFRKKQFELFLKDKDEYISRMLGYAPTESEESFTKQLSELDSSKKSEKTFNQYYDNYILNTYKKRKANEQALIDGLVAHIHSRNDEPAIQCILLDVSRKFFRAKEWSDEYYNTLTKTTEDIIRQCKKDEFIEPYMQLAAFLNYHHDAYQLRDDKIFEGLKHEIIKNYPITEWKKHTQKLDAYYNRKYVSMDEVELMDENNKNGTEFIATISGRDPSMIVSRNMGANNEDLQKLSLEIQSDFEAAKGITEEMKTKRAEAFKELSNRYSKLKIYTLPREERDSLQDLRNIETQEIQQKYGGHEMSLEDKESIQVKRDLLNAKEIEWYKKIREENRQETFRKLEEQVKIYIKWAKSQMGG